MANYLKYLLGKEDLNFDLEGNNSSFSRSTSSGGSQEILKINASHMPLLLATRTLELYDSGALDAEEVDAAINQICASLASIHKFSNEDVLDGITSKGSGAVITTLERLKLNSILDIGSGRIITNEERAKLDAISTLSADQINILNNIDKVGSPIGSIIIWPTEIVPENYFECNGAEISRTEYSDLYAKIGTRYGDGDGATTFNIPNYQSEFLRGWSHSSGKDPDAASRTDRGDGTIGDNIGTKQSDELKSHTHQYYRYTGGGSTNYVSTPESSSLTNKLTTLATGGSETRPRNINVMYCIRYKNG